MPTSDLRLGDCRTVMATMAANSIDAVVTDPPYGLEFMGKEWDRLDGGLPQESVWKGRRGNGGSVVGDDDSKPSSRHHVSYGGKRPAFKRCTICSKREFSGSPCQCDAPEWVIEYPEGAPSGMIRQQRWHETWAREAYRVLKPGGHLVAFGGSRTFHRLACALEDAGFELRDTLCWLYGSGFPKSLNLGNGWGTALKPAYEPIILARKPLSGTVAANVVAHGTGALNIDKTRVRPDDASDPKPYPVLASLQSVLDAVPHICAALRSYNIFDTDHVRSALGRGGTLPPDVRDGGSLRSASANGHAPRLTATQDSPDDCPVCRRFGDELTRRVQEAAQVGAPSLADVLADSAEALPTLLRSRDHQCTGHPSTADALRQFSSLLNLLGKYTTNDIERQGRWPANVILGCDCPGDAHEPGCAVRMLDAQSGVSSERPRTLNRNGKRRMDGWGLAAESKGVVHGDSGGASRFFYVAKASRAERNAGLDGMPERTYGLHDDDGYRQPGERKANHTAPLPAANHHPTVKPIALMRWLCRLVTPPDGTILDMFLGSGTTGCAAALEGFAFIGVEQDADYLAIARRRVMYWQEFGEEGFNYAAIAERRAKAIAARQLSMVAD